MYQFSYSFEQLVPRETSGGHGANYVATTAPETLEGIAMALTSLFGILMLYLYQVQYRPTKLLNKVNNSIFTNFNEFFFYNY